VTTIADVLFVGLVCLLTALPTGHVAAAADRGWFPGGDEDEPAPAPQPEEGK
jgi:hypothetical protein